MEVNVLNLGMTRLTQSYDGVHHWHGTTRNAVIVQSFGGVFARLRNAYYHDIQERWFLLDNTQPGWMERINLNGTTETFFAPATNDEEVQPTWTRVTLSEATKLTLFTQFEVNIPTGTPPLVITSTTWVENLNADRVDSLHASPTPEANKLLALDQNSKWPNSTLYMGSGNGIDADMVDGKHFSDIQNEITNATAWKYTSAWTPVTAGTTVTFTHNLNTYFKDIVIHYRPGTSGDPTCVLYPSSSLSHKPDLNMVTGWLAQWYPNINAISLKPVGGCGYNATGVMQTAGQYIVYAK